MTLAIIGSAAYDNIETPTARRERVPGGSGFYSAVAASFFAQVQLTSVVGEDWEKKETDFLKSRHIDVEGLEIRSGAKTLFWSGKYFNNMNERETREIQLNVMGQAYSPIVPELYRTASFVFLANGGPEIHLEFLSRMSAPRLVVADTMDFYIKNSKDALLALLKKIDGLIVNDSEAKMLTGESNCVTAGKKILELGPKFAIVKKGEHGAILVSKDELLLIPAYPTETVIDPTGAGDSFAGGFMGYLAQAGEVTSESIRKALAFGTVIGSFCVEGFSLEAYAALTRDIINDRCNRFKKMIAF